ncbi:hypothetical protein R1sor_020490 [Riccia sorocarpa]|uniref:Uncharacterized protein n=1 Tax=Riccia sorocarpa TaxID=122646 RepID=A0ABD3IFL4_9MARC
MKEIWDNHAGDPSLDPVQKYMAAWRESRISSLKLDSGHMISSQNEITREVHKFFSTIYAMPTEDGDILREREKMTKVLKPVISPPEQATADGKIKSVEVGDGIKQDVSALADDTAVFLAIHKPSFHFFMELLRQFQSAAGARVNYKRSKILIVGRYTRPPDWLLQLLFHVLDKDQPTRYLGVILASALKPQHAWAPTIAAISGRIQTLTDRNLSFEGRCSTLRFLVQSKLSFTLSLTVLRNSQLKTLRQLLQSMLWGSTKEGKFKVSLVAWDLLAAPTTDGGWACGICH